MIYGSIASQSKTRGKPTESNQITGHLPAHLWTCPCGYPFVCPTPYWSKSKAKALWAQSRAVGASPRPNSQAVIKRRPWGPKKAVQAPKGRILEAHEVAHLEIAQMGLQYPTREEKRALSPRSNLKDPKIARPLPKEAKEDWPPMVQPPRR